MLRNSFKIGFELEAFAPMGSFYDEDYSEECCNYLNECDDDRLGDFYNNINSFFNRKYGLRGYTHYDSSVKNYYNGYNGFEWSSPILEFTPTNLMKVKKMLIDLDNQDIHINSSCGFHTHFSYEGINDGDAAWIMLYIATNPTAYLTFTEFEYRKDYEMFPENVHFYNQRYADKEFLDKIKESFENKDYNTLSENLCDYKYRVLRIHPQGTLEWRGPREFLNSKNGIENYIKRLHEVVDVISTALNTKEIKGVSREEFLENLKCVRFNYYDTCQKPELTLVDKRTNRYGIMSWFGSYRCRKNVDFDRMIKKVIENPVLINDKQFSDYTREIVVGLNSRNMLRTVIEKAYKECGKINLNVQYIMVSQNITLMPYLQKDVWKYFPSGALKQLVANASFEVESNYKHKTLDYVLMELPKIYDYETITWLMKFLTHKPWVAKYLLTNQKDKVIKQLKGCIGYDDFDSEMKETFDKGLNEVIKRILDTNAEEGYPVRKFRELCDVCINRNANFGSEDNSILKDGLVQAFRSDISNYASGTTFWRPMGEAPIIIGTNVEPTNIGVTATISSN